MTKSTLDADLDADPILIPHSGRLGWLFPSGRIVMQIRGGDEPGDDDDKPTISVNQMNQIVQDRLAQAERNRKPVEVKPADYDDLKAKATKFDELEAANQTALERQQAETARLQSERDAALATAATASEAARQAARRSAIVAAAVTNKAVNPDHVFALLPTDAVTIGDDGQVTGADEAVKAFLALPENAHLVGTQTLRPDPAQGERTATLTPSVKSGREMFAASQPKPAATTTT